MSILQVWTVSSK